MGLAQPVGGDRGAASVSRFTMAKSANLGLGSENVFAVGVLAVAIAVYLLFSQEPQEEVR